MFDIINEIREAMKSLLVNNFFPYSPWMCGKNHKSPIEKKLWLKDVGGQSSRSCLYVEQSLPYMKRQ